MRFPPACPEIPVRDLAESLAYYRDRLGFAVDWADETLGLAGLSRGEARLFMSNAPFRSIAGNEAPLVLWVNLGSREEVDALHEAWSAAGAVVTAPPEAKPYKLYEFLVEDPDRNRLRIFYDFGWEENQ